MNEAFVSKEASVPKFGIKQVDQGKISTDNEADVSYPSSFAPVSLKIYLVPGLRKR